MPFFRECQIISTILSAPGITVGVTKLHGHHAEQRMISVYMRDMYLRIQNLFSEAEIADELLFLYRWFTPGLLIVTKRKRECEMGLVCNNPEQNLNGCTHVSPGLRYSSVSPS